MPILKHFAYSHLPDDLQRVSQKFSALAHDLVEILPPGAELSTALRKLLEGKDAAVRATLEARPS